MWTDFMAALMTLITGALGTLALVALLIIVVWVGLDTLNLTGKK